MMGRFVESQFELDMNDIGSRKRDETSPVQILSVDFQDHACDLEVSKSYLGLLTMYHLYTVEVEASGLPSAEFATVEFNKEGRPKNIFGWRWVSWPQTLDMLHGRVSALERLLAETRTMCESQCLLANGA